ncbi:MAG: hypothetical protein HKN76_09150 [Saprospiraceae bacterium]|nr:hypothetical protein [Saprospiraceae bacterium]
MKTFLLILSIAMGMTFCESEKDLLVTKFEKINKAIISGQFEQIIPELDSQSTGFLNLITDTSNLSPGRIVQIGEQYGVSLFCLQYLHEFGNYIRRTSQKEDFFKYLATQGTPWFSTFDQFNLVDDRVRLGKHNYIPIAKKANGSNILYWLKFTKDSDGSFKFDLVDFVQQEEKRRWKFFSGVLGPKSTGDELKEQMTIVWDHLGEPKEETRPFNDYEFDRTKLYEEK